MKRICFTYHMKRGSETAETCITLPMEDAVAADVLAHGENSKFASPGATGAIYLILLLLSDIQGYEYIGICTVEAMEK